MVGEWAGRAQLPAIPGGAANGEGIHELIYESIYKTIYERSGWRELRIH